MVVAALPQIGGACVATYTDVSYNEAENKVEAWAFVEDYFNSGYCFQEVGPYWYYWEHSYEATVTITSPTQNSSADVASMSNVSYGGGSASAYAWLPGDGDPGVYDVETDLEIFCSVIWGLFVDEHDDFTISVPHLLLYTMFIPLDHVRLPPFASDEPVNAADGFFTYVPGASFRIQQALLVDLDLSNPTVLSMGRTVQTRHWDFGTNNGVPNTNVLSNTISCYRQACSLCNNYPIAVGGGPIIVPGYCLTNSTPDCELGANDMLTIQASIVNTTGSSFTVRFEGDPGNACVDPWAWDISWLNEITFSWNGSSWSYTLEMDHDGFPSHDVLLDFVRVYTFDPVNNGQTPASLGWPREIEATVSGPMLPF
jgi:hypothetical protein